MFMSSRGAVSWEAGVAAVSSAGVVGGSRAKVIGGFL